MKKLLWASVFTFSLNIFSQAIPPVLSNYRVENGQASRVYFDSSEEIIANNAKGFVISDKTITSITLNPGQTNGHYFTVSSAFNFWDNNTIRYNGSGSDIKDVDNNELLQIDLQYIDNKLDEPSASTQRYVTVKGSGAHDGTIGNEWTLSEACLNATSGMTVNIEKGNYGDGNFVVRNNGTVNAPIKFIGYKDAVGDHPTLPFVNTTLFSGSEMPYIKSGSNSGNGFDIGNKNYIIVRNIQVEGYYYTIRTVGSNYTILDNVYARGGHGVIYGLSGSTGINQRVINSYVSNATGWGIVTSGRGHLIEDCYISSNYNVGMDYQISIQGNNIANSGHHIIRGNTIYHSPLESNHRGHGITLYGIKPHKFSLVENCSITNIRQGLESRRHNVSDCVWRNIDVNSDGYNGNGAILISGAERCIYDNIRMNDGEFAVLFYSAGISNDPGVTHKGRDNIIKNCVFNTSTYGIKVYNDPDKTNLTLSGNKIINCTFNDIGTFFNNDSADPDGGGNEIINSIINDVTNEERSSNPQIFTFKNSNHWNWWGTNGTPEKGSKNLSESPQFKDASKGDFRLKQGSLLIDKGVKMKEVRTDLDGNLRPQGESHDIGAFEYQDETTGSIKANAGEDQIICKGERTTLTASGGSTYKWSTGATTRSITVSPNSTKTYDVTVTEGGSSATDEVIVTVNSVTAYAGDDVTINEGESKKLSARGGDSYLWSTGETSKSIVVSPTSTKNYTVNVTRNGCEDTDVVKVEVIDITISNPPTLEAFAGDDISICLGESIILNASGGDSYSWNTGEYQNSIEVNPTRTTIYTLTATSNGISTTDNVTVSVENCNMKSNNNIQPDELAFNFEVYPNPSKDVLNVNITVPINELDLTLTSTNGSIVYKDIIGFNQGNLSKQIDLTSFASGVYFVKLSNTSKSVVKKILIM